MKKNIDWITPGGMHLSGQAEAKESEPCLLAMADGRGLLGQLLSFRVAQSRLLFQSNNANEPYVVPYSEMRWLRLLTPVSLQPGKGATAYSEKEWDALLKTAEIHFAGGDNIVGQAAALVREDAGWFLFLARECGEAFRYFIPHHAVEQILLDGEEQIQVAPAQRVMGNKRLADLLAATPDKYPYALEASYGRILGRIMSLWDDPIALQMLFEDLMVDKRGDRQGFPTAVANDIYRLSMMYDSLRESEQEIDPWASEQARRELEQQGHAFSPQHFHRMVERNEPAAVALYLQAGMAVDTPGEAGWTPLMVACFNGNEAIAETLLRHGANPNLSDKNGYAPLHWAAFNGFSRVTRALLAQRVAVDVSNHHGWTPLMQASARGHLDVVRMLLDAGARVGHADLEGWTALHKAVANRHVAMVECLLAAGARADAEHRSGATPLTLALNKDDEEMVACLRKGAGQGGAISNRGGLTLE